MAYGVCRFTLIFQGLGVCSLAAFFFCTGGPADPTTTEANHRHVRHQLSLVEGRLEDRDLSGLGLGLGLGVRVGG